MEKGQDGTTIQQFIQMNQNVLGIEKSNTPRVNKWWILVKTATDRR